jgi:hypothetical protein
MAALKLYKWQRIWMRKWKAYRWMPPVEAYEVGRETRFLMSKDLHIGDRKLFLTRR